MATYKTALLVDTMCRSELSLSGSSIWHRIGLLTGSAYQKRAATRSDRRNARMKLS
jgi:hypothetical protein